jgi:Ca2+-binding RTX toxin-like protein
MTELVRYSEEYKQLRLKLIKIFEASKADPYLDDKKVNPQVTIGLGFNIEGNTTLRNRVYDALALTNSAEDQAWKAKLDAIITDPKYLANDKVDIKKDLDAVMAERDGTTKTFSLTEDQINNIFEVAVLKFETIVDNWLGGTTVDAGQSLALISLAWQSLIHDPIEKTDPVTGLKFTSIGAPKLNEALKAGNRAEAWYQLRYESTPYYTRRYIESQVFGLFADPANVLDAEAQKAIDMYFLHEANIKAHERDHQSSIKSANIELDKNHANIYGAVENKTLTVDSIGQIFKPIANYIYKTYAGAADQGALLANDGKIDFNRMMTGDVVLGYETKISTETESFIQPIYRTLLGASPTDETKLPQGVTGINDMLVALDDKAYNLQGLYGNDVLIGGKNNDSLYGGYKSNRTGSGDDVLIGGAGDDNLYGGDGQNILRGGAGNDNYYIDKNATSNIIVDEDGTGIIYIEKTAGQQDYALLGVAAGNSLTYLESWTGYLGFWWETNAAGVPVPNSPRYKFYQDAFTNNIKMAVWINGNVTADLEVKNFHSGNFGISADLSHAQLDNVDVLDTVDISRVAAPTQLPGTRVHDPLAFDLNNDGSISTLSKLRNVHFDLDNSGFAEQTSWVAPSDGLLVLDRNHNNFIDGGAELFGNQTTLKNGTKAKDGFEALADFDTNADGKINNSDSIFTELKLWQDTNSNGRADAGELLSLSAAGIAAINLAHTAIDNTTKTNTDTQGVTHSDQGTFTRTNNTTSITHTLWFDADTRNTIAVRNLQNNPVVISAEILALPDAIGFGNNYSLREAMVLDTTGTLKQAVIDFKNATTSAAKKAIVTTILNLWTHQENTLANSRGEFINAKHLGVLESFWGQSVAPQLPSNSAQAAERIYQQLELSVYSQLMQQTQYKTLLAGVTFTQVGTQWHANFATATTQLVNKFVSNDPTAAATLTDFADVIHGYNPYDVNSLYQDFSSAITASVATLSATQQDIIFAIVRAQNDNLTGTAGVDIINGYSGDDNLTALAGNDTLLGGLGNDTLNAGDGNDSLTGGSGFDTLIGGAGDDTYYLNLGDGADTILDSAGTDVVQLGAGITENNVTVKNNGTDFFLALDSGENITLSNTVGSGNIVFENAIEIIRFANGTEWNLARLQLEALKGTSADDDINGFNTDDTIASGAGNDTINAWGGNNILSGGQGDDLLVASIGNDVYRYAQGDGNDLIIDAGGTDRIEFGAGITAEQVLASRDANNNLLLTLTTGGSVTVQNLFAATANTYTENAIESIQFANGTNWDLPTLFAEVAKIKGGDGADSLTGTAGADVFLGGKGNDSLSGAEGDDRYIYRLGDGNDVITDTAGIDRIDLGAGITASQLILRRDAANNLLITLENGGSITVNNAFDAAGNFTSNAIDYIKFADNSAWDKTDMQWALVPSPFIGTDGSDSLTGTSKNEIFIGGKGNDYIEGFEGNDIYQYALGDGKDIIKETDGTDTIQLAANITETQVKAKRDGGGQLVLTFLDGGTITVSEARGSVIETIQFATTSWDQARINQEILNNQIVRGTDGDDVMSSTNTTDILIGGKGNDTLTLAPITYYLSTGAYRFEAGDGVDTITINNYHFIQFGATVDSTSISFKQDGKDLLVNYSANDSIRLKSVFGAFRFDTVNVNISFASGVKWDNSYVLNHISLNGDESGNTLYGLGRRDDVINGFGGNDTLYGGEGVDTLNGGADDDTLYGADGVGGKFMYAGSDLGDSLNGGLGNDTLYGEAGDDTYNGGQGNDVAVDVSSNSNDIYFFEQNDGKDTITDSGGIDTISFGSGIFSSDVSVRNTLFYGLSIRYGSNSSIVMPSPTNIEFIQFSNGEKWDAAAIMQQALRPGSNANEMILGFNSADVLVGNKGDDYLLGQNGADVYQYNLGDGDDLIADAGSDGVTDTVRLGATIAENSLSIIRKGTDFIVSFADGGSVTLSRVFVNETDETFYNNTESLTFANGTVWGLSRLLQESKNSTAIGKVVTGTTANDTVLGSYANDELHGNAGVDTINGAVGNDVIYGDDGADVLSGGSGSDTIYGGNGNDIIDAGSGLDTLNGGAGDDIYLYEIGDGSDTINVSEGNDRIVFGQGIYADSIVVRKNFINLPGFKDPAKITIADSVATMSIEFADGTVWSPSDVRFASLKGTSSNDVITGYETDDFIDGLGGTDIIRGSGGNDTLLLGLAGGSLYGNDGNDLLINNINTSSYELIQLDGGLGDDTYRIRSGTGLTYIAEGIGYTGTGSEGAGGYDVVELPQGTEEANVTVRVAQVNNNNDRRSLTITLSAGEVISFESMFEAGFLNSGNISKIDSVRSIDKIKFANGVEWDINRILLQAVKGSSANDIILGLDTDDVIEGGAGDDIIEGSRGSDTLVGGAGNDTLTDTAVNFTTANETYKFNRGDGQDTIYDTRGSDRIEFGSGILSSDVTVTRSANKVNLIMTLNTGESITLLNVFDYVADTINAANVIENIKFNDGTQWDFAKLISFIPGSNFDTTAPSQPSAAFDTTGKIISGAAEAGSTISVKNASALEIGTVVANAATGAYSITLTTALINSETVNITAKDAAGNISIAASITAPLVDVTPPTQPTAAFDTAGKIITGVAELGSTVVVKNAANTQLGTVVANVTTGAYTITLVTALINKETVKVTAKDVAGNTSVAKNIIAPDLTPPAQPTGAFNSTGKTITGTAEKNSIVVVKNAANVQIGTATANATTGAYSIPLTPALTHRENVNITAKDAAGNVSIVKTITAPSVAARIGNPNVSRLASTPSESVQLELLIQAMAAFSPPSAAQTRPLVGYYDNQQPVLVSPQ